MSVEEIKNVHSKLGGTAGLLVWYVSKIGRKLKIFYHSGGGHVPFLKRI